MRRSRGMFDGHLPDRPEDDPKMPFAAIDMGDRWRMVAADGGVVDFVGEDAEELCRATVYRGNWREMTNNPKETS